MGTNAPADAKTRWLTDAIVASLEDMEATAAIGSWTDVTTVSGETAEVLTLTTRDNEVYAIQVWLSEEATDAAKIAAGKAAVDAEIAAEDANE